MIPGLLHNRLLTSPPAGGIIASPAYLPLNSFSSGTTSASGTATFQINPNGTWNTTGTNYTAESGTWFDPITVGAGNAYEVRITPIFVSGNTSTITNAASNWVALSAARQIQLTTQRFNDGTTVSTYDIKVEIRLTGGAIVSTGTFRFTGTAVVSASGGGGGGGGCPTIDCVMPDGRRAGDIHVGDKLLLCDPETGEESWQEVTYAETKLQPCVELITANHVRLPCSLTAPIATDKGFVLAPDTLGHSIWTKVGGVKQLSEVVEIRDMGMRNTRHITVNDKAFWVGQVAGRYALHHNKLNPNLPD